jgi:putative nucleotidyltransferase-like protein
MTSPGVHPFLLGLLQENAGDATVPDYADAESWMRIQREVEHHGLPFLFYRWLTEDAAEEKVPSAIVQEIKADVFRHAARNLMLAGEFISVLKALNEQQIPCVTIRGLALAEQLYGNVTSRCMGDIDVLVRKESLPKVTAVLSNLGYRELDRRPGFARSYSYTLEFIKAVHGWVTIEPHWSIAYPPFVANLDMNRVWSRCRRGRVLGIETWQLEHTDLVLHLCLHLIHRGLDAPLLWYWEVDQLIRRVETDWSSLVETAHLSGQEPLVSRVLHDLCELLHTPIPIAVLSDLDRSDPEPKRARSRSLADLIEHGSAVDGVESFALVFAIGGLRAKLRYLLALFFPSREFMRLHYGIGTRRDLTGWYLTRITRFIWEGLKGMAVLLKDHPRSTPLH